MINITGTLNVRTISGRHGDFNVAKLSTSIGEFTIKDAVLDQYEAGRYDGNFVVEQIKPSYYSTAGGTLIVEIRAYLHSMSLDGFDDGAVEPDEPLVQDPAEEEVSSEHFDPDPAPAPPPAPAPVLAPEPTPEPVPAPQPKPADAETPFGMSPEELNTPVDPDKALFGHIWPLSNQVRLDATVDRLTQRKQVARLRELGYELDFKAQSWNLA